MKIDVALEDANRELAFFIEEDVDLNDKVKIKTGLFRDQVGTVTNTQSEYKGAYHEAVPYVEIVIRPAVRNKLEALNKHIQKTLDDDLDKLEFSTDTRKKLLDLQQLIQKVMEAHDAN